MAKTFDSIDPALRGFIQAQKLFFVATSPLSEDGHINLSPKGLDGTLAVLDDRTIAYLDLTGSGVETIAHLRENGRICMMFCAFEGDPLILRVYGQAQVIHPRDADWNGMIGDFPEMAGSRQIFDVTVEAVQTSCGSGVPVMGFERDRVPDDLLPFYEKMGPEGVRDYWKRKNTETIDGFDTALFDD